MSSTGSTRGSSSRCPTAALRSIAGVSSSLIGNMGVPSLQID